MFGLGLGELLVILVVVLLFFGTSKLPQLGQGLGDGMKSFKRAFREARSDDPGAKPPPAP